MLRDIFSLKGITKKIILSFSILIFVILAVQLAVSYYAMQTTVQNINKNYIAVNIKQKNEKLNKFINEIDLFSKTILSNKEIQRLLVEGSGRGNSSITNISNEISYALSNTIQGVILISSNGTIYQDAELEIEDYVNLNIDMIKNKVSKSQGELCFLGSKFINYGTTKHGDYFFFAARKIKDINSFDEIGLMVMAIRESELWSNFVMDGEIGDYYLVSGEGNIVSCRNKEDIGGSINRRLGNALQKINWGSSDSSYVSGGLVVNKLTNGMSGWNIVNVVPINELNSNFSSLQNIIILMGIAAIVISIYLSIIISRKITRPIRDMIVSMKRVTAGNLNVQTGTASTGDPGDELSELNNVFNRMTKELQFLLEKVYQDGIREKEAELRALRAQINPHFLYNTLDTIYWMLIEKSDYDIAELVTKLGEILRYSIKKGSANVQVKEELQQVENYLFIQKARFEENLSYEIQVEPEILNNEVLSFLIQPFVENSINHGIMRSKGWGKVVIKGYARDGLMIFEIIDDGSGMSGEQIKKLFEGKGEKRSTNSGIGITNVHERIKYLYGEEYGVDIESSEGQGTRIIVRIPTTEPGVTRSETENIAG